MFYLDTSLIVALLTPEAASERADAWVSAAGAPLVISSWVVTEVSSALFIKVRTGALSEPLRAEALARWHSMAAEALLTQAIADRHFVQAAAFVDRHRLGLRAGDALHLAVAADAGCILVTLDRRFVDAAAQAGVPVVSV